MYVATVELGACGGCHNSLLLVGEPLISLLCDHTIAFSSQLVDARSVSPADVVIATGCIRNSEEQELAREIARTSRKVIAVGSCAVHGGIPGLGGVCELPQPDMHADLPRMLERAEPLDSHIDIDLYVPGCPPPPYLIFESLKSLLEGYTQLHLDSTVCSECHRKVRKRSVKSWSYHRGGGADEGCLLNSGCLCLGPVTRGGCRAACPSLGATCIGCRGPSDMVLSSQLHSVYGDMVRYVSLTTGARPEKVEKGLAEMLELLYLFVRQDPVLRAKVGEKVPDA